MEYPNLTFDSRIKNRGFFDCDFSDDEVKNEPMFFNSDLKFAFNNGGPITKAFIDALPDDWLDANPVVDSRVHMLMKNWYPCIPGYHHDDVPRSRDDGQPNYIDPEYFSEHLTGLVNAEICPTTFIVDNISVCNPNGLSRVYNVWNDEIEFKLNQPNPPKCYKAESGILIQFDANTFHTGVKAVSPGWRWFIRLSRNTNRQANMSNEIRRQVQVYLEEPMAGW
jgi:hypothetical protein